MSPIDTQLLLEWYPSDTFDPPALYDGDKPYLEYFKAQYKDRINRVLSQKAGFECYGEPDDHGIYRISDPDSDHFDPSLNDEILPYLLNDTVFYHSLIPRIAPELGENRSAGISCHANWNGPDVVWEAFAVYAEEYVELQKKWGILATSDRAGLLLNGILTYEKIPGSSDQLFYKFETVLQEIVRWSGKDENGQAMAVDLIHKRMQQLQEKLPEIRGELRSQPMFIGLRIYVKQKLQPLMRNYLHKSLGSLSSLSTSTADIFPADSIIPDQSDVVLFSTAGTGKTYQILKFLSSRGGMYTVAPNTQPSSDHSTMLQSTRGGASSDLFSLFKDLKSLHRTEHLLKEHLVQGNYFLRRLVQSLMFARFCLWKEFFKMNNSVPDYTRWTQLQVSCSEHSDPFDAAWRLLRLLINDDWITTSRENEEVMRLWCVDEAQSAFDDLLAKAILKHLWGERLQNSYRILSGTSLELTAANDFAKENLPLYLPRSFQPVTDLGLITSQNFWTFFHGYLGAILTETNVLRNKTKPLLARAGRSLDFSLNLTWEQQQFLLWMSTGQCPDLKVQSLRNFLATESTFFFGRRRFSTLLVEHILRRYCEEDYLNKPLDEAVIQSAIQRATDAAVDALRNQLDKIQNTSWVEDLYWMAIRADVYSQSSIVKDKTARLVSEGFAMVSSMTSQTPIANVRLGGAGTEAEERYVEAALCEPLAVYAVIKYLQEKNKYDDLVHRFFSLLQIDNIDQGAIGKIAEYIISCKLDNFLSDDPRQPTGLWRNSQDTIGIHRRTKLYEIFSTAHRLDLSDNTWVQDTMNFQNVFLLGRKVNTATESSTELAPWLHGITNSDHSRFFFPKKKDGPDLMFVIGQEDSKLLCVLQLKTGKDEHQSKKIKDAVRSLVKGLKGGLSTYTGPIMFINVATSTSKPIDSNQFKEITKDLLFEDGRYPVRQGQGHDYFGFIDGTKSPEVWGETFYELIRLMKKIK